MLGHDSTEETSVRDHTLSIAIATNRFEQPSGAIDGSEATAKGAGTQPQIVTRMRMGMSLVL